MEAFGLTTLGTRPGAAPLRTASSHPDRRGSDARQENRRATVQALDERLTPVAVEPSHDDRVVNADEDVWQFVRSVFETYIAPLLPLTHDRCAQVRQDAVRLHLAEVED